MEALISFPTALVVLGLVLLTVEIVILGFGTLFLVFIGLACFGTALLQAIGVLPESMLASFASVAIQSLLFAVALWKPIRAMQDKQQDVDSQPNSLEGLSFILSEDLAPGAHIVHRYSGVDWKVYLNAGISQALTAGTEVEAVKTQVGKMYVEPTTPS
jgi:membrane protein implicated in regulation of membrane protease activity